MKKNLSYYKKALKIFKNSATIKLPKEEKETLWKQIEDSISTQKKKTAHFKPMYWTAACISLFIISGSYFIYMKNTKKIADEPVITISQSHVKSNESVKLITVDGDEITFDGEEPEIIAGDHLTKENNKPEKPSFSQLIVPPGKKSYLIFDDGTRLWVNSDTKVIYPEKFDKDNRTIRIEGEVYAEVSEDKERPFIVSTQSMDIRVLGTEFNLSAYGNDQKQSVILVKGSVKVQPVNFDPVILAPNTMLTIDNNELELKKNIDVYEYICWKDNLLVLNSITFGDLINKLNRYYDCEIIIEENLKNRILSGKLDLKNNLEDVIRSLSISLNYSYEFDQNNTVIINSKKQ